MIIEPNPLATKSGDILSWHDIKLAGSQHYKRDPSLVEPIDLYRDGDMLRDFALCSIIKYAYRNRGQTGKPIKVGDLDKIIHYAEMLKYLAEKENEKDQDKG